MEQFESVLINKIFIQANAIYCAQYISKKIREATKIEFISKPPLRSELLKYMDQIISIGLFSIVEVIENKYEYFSGIYNAVRYDDIKISYMMPEMFVCSTDKFFFEIDCNCTDAANCLDERMKECDVLTIFRIIIKRGTSVKEARQITSNIFGMIIKKYESYALLCYLWMNYKILNLPIEYLDPKNIKLTVVNEIMSKEIARVIYHFYT
jgi:hypothetical protein